MSDYKLSIVIPCWERPQRTRRIINNILSQNVNNWEAFIIGDGCSYFQEMIDSGEGNNFIKTAETNGNKLHLFNNNINYGGHGYKIVDYAIENSQGEYFIFAGNDDILNQNHFQHYLSEVEDSDMVAYPTFVAPHNQIREPQFHLGGVGHSEIIVKTSIIKDYKHNHQYGHDWDFISFILSRTDKVKISDNKNYTYIVTHIPPNSIDMID